MTREEFNRQARRAGFLTVALIAALVFGAIVLAGGDWLPGGLIVASSVVGLATQISVIRKFRRDGPSPAPPKSKPAS